MFVSFRRNTFILAVPTAPMFTVDPLVSMGVRGFESRRDHILLKLEQNNTGFTGSGLRKRGHRPKQLVAVCLATFLGVRTLLVSLRDIS